MVSAKVGIELITNSAQFKSSIGDLKKYIEQQLGSIKIPSVEAPKTKPRTDGKSQSDESIDGAKRATQLIAAEEAKLNSIKEKFSSQDSKRDKALTMELVNNTKKLQDEKQKVINAISVAQDKATKDHLTKTKQALDQELRLNKQVLLDKGGVQTGGMGAKIGMQGVGRNLASAMPGGGAITGVMDMMGGGKSAMLATGIGAVAVGLQQVISIGSQFETTLAKVKSITGATDVQMKAFGESARDLAKTYGGSASDQLDSFAGLLSKLGPAVGNSPESLKSLGNSVALMSKSSAGELNPAEAMEALTGAMAQFGDATLKPAEMAAAAAQKVDMMSKGAQVGSANMKQVGESLLQAGSILKSSNVTFAESNALVQVAGTLGGKYGSEAGIAIRNVAGLMTKNSSVAHDALKAVGVDFNHLTNTLNTKGMAAALEEVKGGVDKLTTSGEKNALMAQVFGTENAAMATTLMNNTSVIKDFTGQINDSAGSAKEQADAVMATFAESSARALAGLQDFALTIYQVIQPALMLVMGIFTDMIMPVLGFFVDILGAIIKVIFDVGKVIIQWIAEGLKPVAEWIKKAWEVAKIFAQVLWEKLQPILKVVGEFLMKVMIKVLKQMWEHIKLVAGIIKDVLIFVFNKLVDAATGVWKVISTVIGVIADAYAWVIKFIGGIIDWGASFLGLGEPIKSVIEALKSVIEWVGNALDSVVGFFSSTDNEVNLRVNKTETTKAITNMVGLTKNEVNPAIQSMLGLNKPVEITGPGTNTGTGATVDEKELKKQAKAKEKADKQAAKSAEDLAKEEADKQQWYHDKEMEQNEKQAEEDAKFFEEATQDQIALEDFKLQQKLNRFQIEREMDAEHLEEQKKNEAERLKSQEDFIKGMLGVIEDGNAMQFMLQQFGLETNLEALRKSKTMEAAIWIATEFQKNAATKMGLFENLWAIGKSIAANIALAASAIATAIANAFMWLWGINPFLAIGASAGIVGGIISQWGSIKKSLGLDKENVLGFADGGIVSSPIFSPFMLGGKRPMAGEAGKELILPLSKAPAMIADTIDALSTRNYNRSSSGSGIAGQLNELVNKVNEQRILILDSYGTKLSIDKAIAEKNRGNF